MLVEETFLSLVALTVDGVLDADAEGALADETTAARLVPLATGRAGAFLTGDGGWTGRNGRGGGAVWGAVEELTSLLGVLLADVRRGGAITGADGVLDLLLNRAVEATGRILARGFGDLAASLTGLLSFLITVG